MEYNDFLKLLMTYKKLNDDFNELYEMGFDFCDGKYKLENNVSHLLQTVLESHYIDKGVDIINYFIFENEYGQKDLSKITFYDNKNNKIKYIYQMVANGYKTENIDIICDSFESVWQYIKQYERYKK